MKPAPRASLLLPLMLALVIGFASTAQAQSSASSTPDPMLGPPMEQARAPSPPADDTQRVVYHADFAHPRRFSAMLTSINNMVNTYQMDLVEYDVRIVFVAHGIRFLTEDPLKNTPFAEDKALKERRADLLARLKSLQEVQGVKLELCNITRESVGLNANKLIDDVELVPSGVVRIAELQRAGFAYLKIE